MALYVRELRREEEQQLSRWLRSGDPDLQRRVQVILLSRAGYRVPEIGPLLSAHPSNLRKWIHRFNRFGLSGLFPRRSPGRPRLFSHEQRESIVGLATTEPRRPGALVVAASALSAAEPRRVDRCSC